MVQKNNIIPIGRSIGTGVAVYVSHERKTPGTILITPYECMAAVAQEKYPYIPVRLLLKHDFDSESRAKEISTPMCCITAGKDEIIPVHHAKKLISVWKGKVNEKFYADYGHNAVQENPVYYNDLFQFANQLIQLP